MKKIAIIYHMWPNYRLPIMRELDRSSEYEFHFFGSGEAFRGIPHCDIAAVRFFNKVKYRYFGRFLWQPAAMSVAFGGRFDAIILLGDPNFITTWIAGLIGRVRRTPIMFWAHGWLRREKAWKRRFRKLFYSIADRMLVYSDRSKSIGISEGFPAERIIPIYNSLDFRRSQRIVEGLEREISLGQTSVRSFFEDPALPVIICTARLTQACRFDILLQAAKQLREEGTALNILLVGDGPERRNLEGIASDLDLKVHFFGACFDEEIVGPMLYEADLTVSPGKVGLTAMHSLAYGTPVITHDNFDEQMPEFEAIIPGKSGAFFTQNSATSLAKQIKSWLSGSSSRSVIRRHCMDVVRSQWNPEVQSRIICRTLDKFWEDGAC